MGIHRLIRCGGQTAADLHCIVFQCLWTKRTKPCKLNLCRVSLAEREGFEPPVQLPVHRISSAARSTTPASLQNRRETGEAPPSGPVGSDVYHPFGAANINKISQIVLFHDKKVVRKRKFAPRTHRSVQYPRPARVYMNETGRLSKIIPTFVRKPFRY